MMRPVLRVIADEITQIIEKLLEHLENGRNLIEACRLRKDITRTDLT